jgi:hypothetical protein
VATSTSVEGREGSVRPRQRWPVVRFEAPTKAPAEAVYALLADLSSHLQWAGNRQSPTFRLLSVEAPDGPATVGAEFHTTGADGKKARWTDRSVVTEAIRPSVFEFVTEGRRDGKAGSEPLRSTTVHRYEIVRRPDGCDVTYTAELTRLTGPTSVTRIARAPVIGPLLWRTAGKYMRRGFANLLALAEEREGSR